jgi:hypothetical protein
VVAEGVTGVVETPFGWLVLGSAILDLILVVVAKRDKLPGVDAGLASEIREIREIRDIRDTELKGLNLILGQNWYL